MSLNHQEKAAGDSSGETLCKGQKSMLSVLTSCLYGDLIVLGIDSIHLLKWCGSVFGSRMTNMLRKALIKEDKYNKQLNGEQRHLRK